MAEDDDDGLCSDKRGYEYVRRMTAFVSVCVVTKGSTVDATEGRKFSVFLARLVNRRFRC